MLVPAKRSIGGAIRFVSIIATIIVTIAYQPMIDANSTSAIKPLIAHLIDRTCLIGCARLQLN